MNFLSRLSLFTLFLSLPFFNTLHAQITLGGIVMDGDLDEPLINATLLVKGTTDGTVADFDGNFEIKTNQSLPLTLVVSFIGYTTKEFEVTQTNKLKFVLNSDAVAIAVVEVKGQRISDKQKASPLTVESLDILAIKETPSDNFYDGLGALKGIDLTAASLGFKVINMRGFNSTSPVRSLQIIDGVDNQSPGLNFSLGNFLGASELDMQKVDLIVGASSAFYGPNAFNGVISMTTKSPFIHKGLSAMVKGGERNLFEASIRWADAIKNKDGLEWMAYKINLFTLRADDWVADNFNAVDGTDSPTGNPGGWDDVNAYGDEYFSLNDFSDDANLASNTAGLGLFHRTGYSERGLVDYDTKNTKASLSLHFRLKPEDTYDSPELILASNFGAGTTVYQGDNRFSLQNILFFQNRIELRKRNKWFIRAYATNENAGDSYDPYFTALRLQELAKSNELWAQDYAKYWKGNIFSKMQALEFPEPTINSQFQLVIDHDAINNWFTLYSDSMTVWHALTADAANLANPLNPNTSDYFVPGTERFQMAFDSIRSLKNNEGGTRFFDKSALYHAHGEYTYSSEWIEKIVVGANARLYRPNSEGTVFSDTSGTKITNSEYGVYLGFEKKFTRKWILNGTIRMDKNQNFNTVFTPAASIVWTPNPLNYLRLSFSSGVRNPTLADQYLNLNVGPATLIGNLNGYDNLITVESFKDYLSEFNQSVIERFDVAPIQPENVKTFEVGYRTTLFNKIYVDAGYYYSFYNSFIGYNIGIDAKFSDFGIPEDIKVYRISANSTNEVTTQGFSIGLNYYFAKYYSFAANYSWNRLNKAFPDDPIIPAFNTPEHKYNIGISGRDMPLSFLNIKHFGFNINYKWIQGFLFEGSPQFTGLIKDYSLVDAQVNVRFAKLNTTLKVGASNLLNNKAFQTYGGPKIGRLAYVSLLYNFEKK